VRGEDGLCIECEVDEAGEMISQIVVDPLKPGQRFDGYADKAETEKKILRDVFVPGDTWFRTGDLLRRDRRGYFYFVDRIGDTFRWKGENVSTSEVAETLTVCHGVDEVNVYGVEIAGVEGRAGMAAIATNADFSLDAFRQHMHRTLSPHARPRFIRLQQTIAITSTFKLRKLDLMRDGFDPRRTPDPLYFDDPAAGRLVRIDSALYGQINSGAIRL